MAKIRADEYVHNEGQGQRKKERKYVRECQRLFVRNCKWRRFQFAGEGDNMDTQY